MHGNIEIKRVFFVLLIMFCSFSNCFAQEQNVFHSEEGHFSLVLPENWFFYSQEELQAENVQSGKIVGKEIPFIALFEKKINSIVVSEMSVQIDTEGRVPESDVQQNMLSPIGQTVLAEGVEKSADKRSVKLGRVKYDKERHIIYSTMSVDNNGQKEMRISALALSQYGFVTLTISSLTEDIDSNLDDFFKIMDSFNFDKGFGY